LFRLGFNGVFDERNDRVVVNYNATARWRFLENFTCYKGGTKNEIGEIL